MRPRRGEFGELRELIEKHVAGQVVNQIRGQLTRWNSPAAKLERKRKRTSAQLGLWLFVTFVLGLTLVLGLVGTLATLGMSGAEEYGALVVGAAVTLGTGALSVRSGVRLHRLTKEQQRLAASPHAAFPATKPALPPRNSLAREPMQRLDDAERVLDDLLRQVGSSRGGSVPSESVEQARATGAEAAVALRAVATQLVALERAREHVSQADRESLDEAVERLREQLDEGLDGYGTLIAAAGRLVAASSAGGPDRQALTDATDHLHGLAVALRELFPDRQ